MNTPEHSPAKKGGGYPQEFREEAVRYRLSSGKKAGEVAPELGVSDWSLNRRRKEMEQAGVSTPSQVAGLNALELAKENGRLRRENEALSRQRDILKRLLPSVQRTARPEVRDDSISYHAGVSAGVSAGAGVSALYGA